MKSNQQQMIASIVKEARIAKGYTQKELSELSNISIRSIQRIENAQLQPRSYTLKLLSDILDINAAALFQPADEDKPAASSNRTQKIILSAGMSLVSILLFWAFLAQSRFPETTFELLLALAIFTGVLMAALWFTWRTKN